MRFISEKIDLKEIERKAFLIQYEDGLLEILFGIVFFISNLQFEWGYMGNIIRLIIQIVFIISFILLKKKISEPRIGRVKYGLYRNIKKIKISMILLIYVFFFIIMSYQLKVIFSDYVIELFMIMVVLPLGLCIFSYFTEYKRGYLIALLVEMNYFLALLLFLAKIPEPLNLIISSIIVTPMIITIGIITFNKFLKKYRLPKNIEKKN
ncbi:MAG: hypothetical protein JXA99_00475 [Candidatus Lokiarchaeota archaeon]|nr:hypothetical protein [Candidatus Lokiarchaeota archaeon]